MDILTATAFAVLGTAVVFRWTRPLHSRPSIPFPENNPIKIGSFVKKIWGHPLAKNVDVNDENTVVLHRRILQAKPLLKDLYLRWYAECLPAYEATKNLGGEVVEIGCGAGVMEEVFPDILKTEAVPSPFSMKVVDAMNLDFKDESLRAIFLIGVLHHIPYPGKFLAEAQRCLKPGGRLVMVEPHNSFLQRFLCKVLEHYEFFDDEIPDWVNGSQDRMTNANMALPWVIFMRDRARFDKEFPKLKLLDVHYHTFISMVVTGGMSYRQFVPSFFLPLLHLTENILKPFMPSIGTMMTLDLVKR